MEKKLVSLSFLLPIACFLFSCQSTQTGNPVDPNHTEQIYGYLYNSDGTPAVNARISLIPSKSIPATSLLKKSNVTPTSSKELSASATTADGVTDKHGRYSFSYVPSDTYNIFGNGNGNLSYHPSISISSDKDSVLQANDTLNPPGSLKGRVIANPPIDPRRIFVLVIGGYIVRWPDDSTGNFTLNNMAEGTYHIRFLPTDPNTPVFDTTVTISSGKETDIGTVVLETSAAKKAKIDSIHAEKDSVVKSYLQMKFGVLIYLNMGTFALNSTIYPPSASPATDEKIFNPTSLDCGQWADAVKAAGGKYIILTVKDEDCFCLWNSSTTTHDVGSCSWAQGKRDIVKEFTDSARTRGLKVGFYYSMESLSAGRPLDSTKTQLTELLSNYGEISCLLFHGPYGDFPFKNEIYSFVYSLQKNCVVIQSDPSTDVSTDIVGFYYLKNTFGPQSPVISGAEAIESIHPNYWFWHKNIYFKDTPTDTPTLAINNCDLLAPQRIVDHMNACNALNENCSLSICPDTTGLIPQCQVECLKSVGALRGTH